MKLTNVRLPHPRQLVAPAAGDTLYGVLQVINHQPLGALLEDGARQLCQTLGLRLRQRLQRVEETAQKAHQVRRIVESRAC
jgi:hypothetical protein